MVGLLHHMGIERWRWVLLPCDEWRVAAKRSATMGDAVLGKMQYLVSVWIFSVNIWREFDKVENWGAGSLFMSTKKSCCFLSSLSQIPIRCRSPSSILFGLSGHRRNTRQIGNKGALRDVCVHKWTQGQVVQSPPRVEPQYNERVEESFLGS